MPLYIRDDEVDQLAQQLAVMTNARSKTDAVRKALRDAVETLTEQKPLLERIAPALALADAIGGPNDPDFDMKAYTDEMWGDI